MSQLRLAARPAVSQPGPATRISSSQPARLTGEMRAAHPRSPLPMYWIAIASVGLLGVTAAGAGYYFADIGDRVRSPMHPWLRPSGYVGQPAGLLALTIFLFLWLYPLRRRFRWLAWTGTMAQWLDVHVAAALLMPLLAAVHAGWRFTGLIGLGFWSLMIVWLSGVVGRYLYTRIPRGATGLELSAEEIAADRRRLVGVIAKASRLPEAQVEALLQSDPRPCDGLGLLATLGRMVEDDLARWRAARALRRTCTTQAGTGSLSRRDLGRVLRLARREMALTQQARMLQASQRIFRFWHVVHRPFAIAALVTVVVHVGVALAMGATWFW